jgi:hypothetical protein
VATDKQLRKLFPCNYYYALYEGLKMIKEELTQARLKELLDYNPETGVLTWIARTSKFGKNRVGTIAGGFDAKGYRQIRVDGVLNLEHRLVWMYVHGEFPPPETPFIDHPAGDPSNNRLINLRLCTNTQNQGNRGKNSNNKSGFKGVSWHIAAKSYCAQIVNPLTGKKECYYGYTTPEEASIVYQAKSIEYHGEFHKDDNKILSTNTSRSG